MVLLFFFTVLFQTILKSVVQHQVHLQFIAQIKGTGSLEVEVEVETYLLEASSKSPYHTVLK
jgi:hypothetical protein